MKIMTFNIQHALDYRRKVIDTALFADSIKEFGADICGLNEVRGKGPLDGYTDQTNAIGDRLGFHRYFAEAIKVKGSSPYGNALVSRYPLASAETIAIPDPEVKLPDGRYESRCVLSATASIDGRELDILVCHMGLMEDEQKKAVDAVCRMLDRSTRPTVLMGDFNISPDSRLLLPLFERLSDTDALNPRPGEYTFPSDAPRVKIDYMLYRGLKCKEVKVISRVVSDHLPIIAEFEFMTK